jgi:Ca2+-binding EF-hand superfamily protein
MFIRIDKDKNGQINANELHEFMKKIKLEDNNLSDNNSTLNSLLKVQDIIQETDQNQNNSIDYREFMAV